MKWWDQMPWSSFSECWALSQLSQCLTRSKFSLKKPLSLLIHKKQLLIHENFIMRLKQFNHIFQDLLQILVLLLFPPCLQLLIFWNPQSCSWRVAINIQSLVNIDVLTSSHKLWMSLVASRIVNPIWNEVKVTQCLTLCDPRLYNPWNSPGQNTGVDSRSLLQGIFPTQGLNPGILHCRWILYQLSHQGSPRILEWVVYHFSSGSSLPRNRTGVHCIAGGFFTNWAIREVLLNKLLLSHFSRVRLCATP